METELKFEVDDAGAKALAAHLDLAALGQARKLRSVYYDTPETELRDHGFILRVRDDGRRSVQTVKQSIIGGNGFNRGEWENVLAAKAGDLSPDLDLAAATPLGDVLNRRDLASVQPLFEVEIRRVTRSIEIEGAIVEVALDRGCARTADQKSPIGEIEFELKSGPPRGLFALARECSAVARLDLCFISKSARGYALLDVAAPEWSAIDPPLKPGETAGRAFQTIAGAALTQIAARARFLKDQRDAETLHQLRVAVRRLRSALSIFAPMLAGAEGDAVAAELSWLSGELNLARDLDVFTQEVYTPALTQDSNAIGLAAFGARLTAAREGAYGQVQAAIDTQRFRDLMLMTLAWIEIGDWCLDPATRQKALRDQLVEALAADAFQRRQRKIVKQGRGLEAMAPDDRHHLRIKVKRLRYACGFFAGLYSGKTVQTQKAFSTAARDLQDALGGLTDIAVSRDLVIGVLGLDGAQPANAAAAFAAGALVGQARSPMHERLKGAEKALKALRKAEPFW